ncbi:histone deacetylase [Rhizina undulata]
MSSTPIVQVYDTWTSGGNSTIALDAKTTASIPLSELISGRQPQKVSYHHNAAVEDINFGNQHPMKPWRLRLTNKLVHGYELDKFMDVYKTRAATLEELREFHGDDYLDFLKRVTPSNSNEFLSQFTRFNIGHDCPIFDGIWDFGLLYTGASLDAAKKLINGESDIAINWSGGLHHAKKNNASGPSDTSTPPTLCSRAVYRHRCAPWDGVEQAFASTPRVMTLSFHKHDGTFFPGTGSWDDIGTGEGKHYALNVPLKDGIDDDSYVRLFKSIVEPVINTYIPTAVVLQCGADSLAGDLIGCFNINIKAHGECVDFVKSFGLPLMVVGGGGYTPHNVSRAWAFETAACLNRTVPNDIPIHSAEREYFAPDYKLHPSLSKEGKFENKHSKKYVETMRIKIMEQLRYINGAPSVQMTEIPPDLDQVKSGLVSSDPEEHPEDGEDQD